MITPESTLIDVAFEVCTALDAAGVAAVLVGGSAATYYTDAYRSLDADFVLAFGRADVDVLRIMQRLGFHSDRSQFAHPKSRYTVDFPAGPLAIGRALIVSWKTARREDRVLHVLHRSDSVCDRLAGFYHWNDRNSLIAAVNVAKSGPIDLPRIRSWSDGEHAVEKFQEFLEMLGASSIS